MINMEEVKNSLVGLALAENPGEVNEEIVQLCKHLDLPKPKWNDAFQRYVMDWEEEDFKTCHGCIDTIPADGDDLCDECIQIASYGRLEGDWTA